MAAHEGPDITVNRMILFNVVPANDGDETSTHCSLRQKLDSISSAVGL